MRWTQSLASDLAEGEEMLVCVAFVVGYGDLLQVIVGDASGEGAQQGIGVGAEFSRSDWIMGACSAVIEAF
jgi:hypothetical protein